MFDAVSVPAVGNDQGEVFPERVEEESLAERVQRALCDGFLCVSRRERAVAELGVLPGQRLGPGAGRRGGYLVYRDLGVSIGDVGAERIELLVVQCDHAGRAGEGERGADRAEGLR